MEISEQQASSSGLLAESHVENASASTQPVMSQIVFDKIMWRWLELCEQHRNLKPSDNKTLISDEMKQVVNEILEYRFSVPTDRALMVGIVSSLNLYINELDN